MKNVLYIGQIQDAAGYGETSRNYVAALAKHSDKINLSVKSVSFERFKSDQSAYSSIIAPLLNKPMNPDVQIIHLTPENFSIHKKPNMKNIGYAVWETSKLPEHWVKQCNLMDEIWTACDWNVEVFKSSGVTVPVKKVEHTIDPEQFKDNPITDIGLPKDKFLFYSIFQWTERKCPAGLIRAFLSEFSGKDNVALVLKTYRQNSSEQDRKWIEQEISNIRQSMFLDDHTPVTLVHKILSRQEIISLHKSCQCLVSAHRAEGWGYSMFESLSLGIPTIATGFGGNTEFMDDNNSYLINHTLTPVANMPWKLYSGKGSWAEPDLDDLKKKMRYVYENYSEAQAKAASGRTDLQKYYWENIGKKMVDLILEGG